LSYEFIVFSRYCDLVAPRAPNYFDSNMETVQKPGGVLRKLEDRLRLLGTSEPESFCLPCKHRETSPLLYEDEEDASSVGTLVVMQGLYIDTAQLRAV
jgi:hypothetical protein